MKIHKFSYLTSKLYVTTPKLYVTHIAWATCGVNNVFSWSQLLWYGIRLANQRVNSNTERYKINHRKYNNVFIKKLRSNDKWIELDLEVINILLSSRTWPQRGLAEICSLPRLNDNWAVSGKVKFFFYTGTSCLKVKKKKTFITERGWPL